MYGGVRKDLRNLPSGVELLGTTPRVGLQHPGNSAVDAGSSSLNLSTLPEVSSPFGQLC